MTAVRAAVALALGIAFGAVLVTPGAAQAAAPVPAVVTSGASFVGTVLIESQWNGKCLDADTNQGGVNGNRVQIWDCNVQSQQLWDAYAMDDDPYQVMFVNVRYGKCLDGDAGTVNRDGAKVQLWTCNGWANQKWVINVPLADGWGSYRTLVNAAATAVYSGYLDADNSRGSVNGAKVQLWHQMSDSHYEPNDNQVWNTFFN